MRGFVSVHRVLSVRYRGMRMSRFRAFLSLIVFGILAGCSSVTGPQSAQYSEASVAHAGPAPMRGSQGPYILGPGDRLRIKIYSDPDMTGEYEINSSGAVSLPLVGDIRALGLTTRQLEEAIVSRMKGKLANKPEVSVEIASYAPFYIYGEVKKAGEYPYRIGLTLADAIAIAEGLTYRANENQIYVRRAGRTIEQAVALDQPMRIFPGDNIRVSERLF